MFFSHYPAPPQRLLGLALLFCCAAFPAVFAAAQENPPAKAPSVAGREEKAAKSSLEDQETETLEKAFDSAAGNPQALIRNLEDFLTRFPQSPRREQVLRAIFKQAMQANDPEKAATTGEKLLEVNPEDISLLSALVDLLDRQNNRANREKAVTYATRFIERVKKLSPQEKPTDASAEKWQDTQELMCASGYAMRGNIYAKLGETAKAIADYEKCYEAYPSAQAAEKLGDLASKKGDADRALDHYATSFAFPNRGGDPARRDQLRRKLGSLYFAKYRSEKGLGDLVLSKYDELARALQPRFKTQGTPNANAREPFDYVLQRLDGSELRLDAYRGKVVVMDFWATWCGPCRQEGQALERVLERFRNETAVQFLAVNVDEDRGGVPDFVKEENWTIPVAYAQGLDHLLGVRSLPTLVIFDRSGRVIFRQEGMDPVGFVDTVEKKLREALEQAAPAATASR